MFILFGTRSGNTQFFKLDNQTCPNCANTDTLYAETANTYFHIFFLPFLSTGRSAKVNCTHCRKSFELNQLNPAIQDSFTSRAAVLGKKKPLWHSCGCSVLFLLIGFFAVSTCTSYVFNGSDDEAEAAEETANKPYAAMYAKDLAAATSNPAAKNDSIAYAVKQYANMVLSDELDKANYRYLTKIKGDRLLVIMKVTDMKNVAASERGKLLGVIEEALAITKMDTDKSLYIIVEGKWNTLLVQTPTASETNGRFADQELIYDFYKEELLKSNTVNDTVVPMKTGDIKIGRK